VPIPDTSISYIAQFVGGDWAPSYLCTIFHCYHKSSNFSNFVIPLWKVVKNSATYIILCSKQAIVLMAQGLVQWVQQSAPHPPSPILLGEIQEDLCVSQEANHLSQGTNHPQGPIPLPVSPLGGNIGIHSWGCWTMVGIHSPGYPQEDKYK